MPDINQVLDVELHDAVVLLEVKTIFDVVLVVIRTKVMTIRDVVLLVNDLDELF